MILYQYIELTAPELFQRLIIDLANGETGLGMEFIGYNSHHKLTFELLPIIVTQGLLIILHEYGQVFLRK